MLKMSGIITDQTLSILIDPGATKSFIFVAVLKRIKVKVVEQDEFSFVEMASGAKQKVGGKVTCCSLNLGEFVTRANLYVCWFFNLPRQLYATDPGFVSFRVPTKPKTIGPSGEPEGNATHRMHYAVSPEIAFMGGCKTQVFTA
jgi:hypothetical protein